MGRKQDTGNRPEEAVRRIEAVERRSDGVRAERGKGAVAQAHERLVGHAELFKQLKERWELSRSRCAEAKERIDLFVEHEANAKRQLDEMRGALREKEREYEEAAAALERQRDELREARLECLMIGIALECMKFLVSATPATGGSVHRLSMCNAYFHGGCMRLKVLNDELINGATERFRYEMLRVLLGYLNAAWKMLAASVPGENVRIARHKLDAYIDNWKDENHPVTALREKGAEFRAKLDRDWKEFLSVLALAAEDAKAALDGEARARSPAAEKRHGEPQRSEKPPVQRRKRRKLLTLDYNEQLVKYGYEVRADRETIVFDGNPYLLTAGKVVDIVNDMIIKLCTSPGNPYIRFTSDSAKNFTRGAHREFLRRCIVRKTHFDKGDPEVVITEPLASLRISG